MSNRRATSEQGGFAQAEVDIPTELVRVAAEGLRAIRQAHTNCDATVTQLAFAHLAFMNIQLGGDVLESYVATSVRHVDTVLQKQSSGDAAVLPAMVEEIQWLQRHAYDLVFLACSRSLDQRIFSSPGIPLELLLRLEAAFLAEGLQSDSRWSRLSSSKYRIFRQPCRDPVAAPDP